MKKCPKCGANNRPDSSACYNCFAALGDVQSTGASAASRGASTLAQPRRPAQPAAQPQNGGPPDGAQMPNGGPLVSPEAPSEPVSVVGQPLGAPPQPPAAYSPPGQYTPPPPAPGLRRGEFPRPEPVKTSRRASTFGILALVVILLGGGGFAAWKFLLQPRNPITIVRTFIQASQAQDTEGIKRCISKASQSELDAMGTFMPLGGKPGQRSGFKLTEGQDYVLELASKDASVAVVKIKLQPVTWDRMIQEAQGGPGQGFAQILVPLLKEAAKDGLPLGLVKEGFGWKIDSKQTEIAMKPISERIEKAFGRMFGNFGSSGPTGRVQGMPPPVKMPGR